LAAGEAYTNPAEAGYDVAASLRVRGKPTTSKTAILKNDGTAPSNYLITRTYYDKEYSIIQVNKQNHLAGTDISSNAYDFANRLTKTRRNHTATPPAGTLKTHTIWEEYVYDHASRLRFARHKINANSWVVTSAPLYDELNRLADKRLHASNYNGTAAITTGSVFTYLQSVDYAYNIRGWLTGINAIAPSATTCPIVVGDDLADLFNMNLLYDAPTTGGTAQYNGNISETQWRTNSTTCGEVQAYRFSYDFANRLTAANHFTANGAIWTNTNKYSESGISYDLNGNIKTYLRRGKTQSGTFGLIDVLNYQYDDLTRPDKLTRVNEGATGDALKGFKPYTVLPVGDHYLYDANGNMTTDKNKILTITYNHLNLPSSFVIAGASGGTITLTYTADGEKLTKVGTATKQYVSGIEYTGAALEAMYFSEGRCTPNGTNFTYEYTIYDHLGNARVRFKPNTEAVGVVFIEDLHYYPFGLLMEGLGSSSIANKYSYNDKEYSEDFGLNLYDYHARWLDPATNRWATIDPLTERYKKHSGYNYVLNNPLLFSDPTGMSAENGSCQCVNFGQLNNQISDYNKGLQAENAAFEKYLLNSTQKPTLDDITSSSSISSVPENGILVLPDGERVTISGEGGSSYNVIYKLNELGFVDYFNRTMIVFANPAADMNGEVEHGQTGGGAFADMMGEGMYGAVMFSTTAQLEALLWGRLLWVGKFGNAAKDGTNLAKSQLKSISSLEGQIAKHQSKLSEYIKDPMKFDNMGFLKNAPNDAVRQKIIQSRINHLNQEISTFQNNIQKILNGK
jgi:RHS repeat-associated protein